MYEYDENPRRSGPKTLDDGLFAVAGFKKVPSRKINIEDDDDLPPDVFEDEEGELWKAKAQYVVTSYQGGVIFFNATQVKRIGPSGEYGHDFGYPFVLSIPPWAETLIVAYGNA